MNHFEFFPLKLNFETYYSPLGILLVNTFKNKQSSLPLKVSKIMFLCGQLLPSLEASLIPVQLLSGSAARNLLNQHLFIFALVRI